MRLNKQINYWIIALAVITVAILFTTTKVDAGGPWSDQYCDVTTTTIRVVDQNGTVLEEKTTLTDFDKYFHR